MSLNNTTNVIANNTSNFEEYNSLLGPFRIALVLLLRAGSIMIQLGTFPTENVYNVLFQNIVDISVAISSYSTLGYVLSFGKDDFNNGVLGLGSWIGSAADEEIHYAILGLCAVLLGSSIISNLISGRIHFIGCVVITFSYAGIFQPILMHWIWNKHGWMYSNKLLSNPVQFIDVGGGLISHVTGGIIGLIGISFLGRRLLRLSEIDSSSIGNESPTTIMLGYFFFMLGVIGMSMPVENYKHYVLSHLFMNSLVSIGFGILLSLAIQFALCRDQFNYWGIVHCMQGALNALIVNSPGLIYYTASTCMIVSFIGNIIFSLISRYILVSSFEDYCNSLALHLFGGILGTLFPHFFIQKTYPDTFRNLLWQFICILVVIAVTALLFSLLFLVLWCCGFLRNKSDEICHLRSIKLKSKSKQKNALQRFFDFNRKSVFLEPGLHTQNFNEIALRETKTATFKRTFPGYRYMSTTAIGKPISSSSTEDDGIRIEAKLRHAINPVESSERNIFTLSNPTGVYHMQAKYTKSQQMAQHESCAAMGDSIHIKPDDASIVNLNDLIALGKCDTTTNY